MNLRSVMAAVPDFAIGLAFLATWIRPDWLGVDMLPYALLMMLLEFIVIHSAAFMGFMAFGGATKGRTTLWILGLGVFYTTFVGAFAAVFGSWWPLWAFWSLVVNRLASALLAPPDSDQSQRVFTGWGISVLLYLFWVFFTLLVPLPRFGITDAVIADAHIPGEGMWVESPQIVVAAAVGYFLSQGYAELRTDAWARNAVGQQASVE